MACAYTQRKKDEASGAAEAARGCQKLLTEGAAREVAAADEDAAAYAALQATWAKDYAGTAAEKAATEAACLAVPVELVAR